MANYVKMAILAKYPDHDFDRYSFKFGDVLRTNNGALIFVIHSAIKYVEAFVLKSSFGFKRYKRMQIKYTEIPYYKKDEFKGEELVVSKKIKWSVGDVVIDPEYGSKLLLTEQCDGGGFYALVLECENKFYTETSVYVTNPYIEYVSKIH